MRSTDPKGRLAVIGGDPRWKHRLCQLAEEAGLIPEIMSRDEASRLEAPVARIVVHVARADDKLELETLRRWAPLGLQSVSIVSLESSPGVAELIADLEALGFERILLARPWVRAEGLYWSEMARHVADLAAPNLALVPILIGMLGRSDIGLVRLVAAVLQPPVPATVERWRERLRVSRRELNDRLRDLGFPNPKRTLDTLRVTLAVHLGAHGYGTLDEIARGATFGSGDYLGRRCRRLTGRSFGELVRTESGLSRVVRMLEAG